MSHFNRQKEGPEVVQEDLEMAGLVDSLVAVDGQHPAPAMATYSSTKNRNNSNLIVVDEETTASTQATRVSGHSNRGNSFLLVAEAT